MADEQGDAWFCGPARPGPVRSATPQDPNNHTMHPSLRAYHDALASLPQSKFAALSPDEFASGLATTTQADAGAEPHVVRERCDLLVFAGC